MHQTKNLVLVLAISVLVTDSSEELVLKRVLCICYLVIFQEGQEPIKTLFDSNNEVNVISPSYAEKLGFMVWKTNFKAQKIDGFTHKTFERVIADF